MTDKISERLARPAGIANLVELLSSRLSGSDLHSLNLKILKNRLARASWSPADLLKDVPVTSALGTELTLRLFYPNRRESESESVKSAKKN